MVSIYGAILYLGTVVIGNNFGWESHKSLIDTKTTISSVRTGDVGAKWSQLRVDQGGASARSKRSSCGITTREISLLVHFKKNEYKFVFEEAGDWM